MHTDYRNPRYPWVVGLIKWTLFKIGGRFKSFLLWILFSRGHAVRRPFFAIPSRRVSYLVLALPLP